MALTPIRRVVTGNDERGRSKVIWDGPSPGVHEAALPGVNAKIEGRGHTDFWVWRETPPPLDGKEDAGTWPDEFPCPVGGGHQRVVHWLPKTPESPPNAPYQAPEQHGRTWDRGGGNHYNRSYMHKTKSLDYGIMISGERTMELDDAKLTLYPGDVVIDVGAWHLWDSSAKGCLMAFDMFDCEFETEAGLAVGNDKPMRPPEKQQLPPGVKPQRRVVAIDREAGKSSLVGDTSSPDVRFDPARPGFALHRMWVVKDFPAKLVYETLHLPNVLIPPVKGSVLNVFTFPPDSSWKGKVGEKEVTAYFQAMGAGNASTYSPQARHPYMQKTRTLDICIVLEGEITLVLDTQEVALKQGEFVINRGVNHAWSNRSGKPAVVSIASHDGK
ncbi:MAG TPA: cupin domain-containing protein [Burkholderiales bacterium]|nr:cupin domain-containing protein [Burkholderiales bacterium]